MPFALIGILFWVVHVSVYDHILNVCGHNVLQTACGNFAIFINYVQLGTKMN